MALVTIRTPRYRQPQDAPALDYSNALAKNLKMLLIPQGGRLIDLVNPSEIWTPNNNATVKPSTSGIAASFDGTDDYFSCTGYAGMSGYGTFFLFSSSIRGLDSLGTVWFGSSGTYFQNNGGQMYSFSTQILYTPNVSGTKNTSLIFTGTGSGTAGYVNGLLASTSSAGTALATGSKSLTFGKYVGGPSWDANADVEIAGFSSDVWTENMAKSFHANPWQLFAPHESFIWVPDAAAARRRVVFCG